MLLTPQLFIVTKNLKVHEKVLNYDVQNSTKCYHQRTTHFCNFLRMFGDGVPRTSWILAIWSTSLEPGKRGCKLLKEHTITLQSQHILHSILRCRYKKVPVKGQKRSKYIWQNCIFGHNFPGWIWAKLRPVCSKKAFMIRQYGFLYISIAIYTLLIRHVQKSKCFVWMSKWPTSLGFSIF